MAITIDAAFIEEYRNLVTHTVQQSGNLLRSTITEVSSGGKAYNFELLGPTEMVAKTGRRVDTVYADDDWTRRVAGPGTFTNTMTVESEDKVQMLVDPMSNYHKAQGMAINRKYDDLIIAAATGTALDGDGVANAFPAGQVIGSATQLMDFDIITAVQEKFMQNFINPDVPKCMVIGPTQVRALLKLEQQTNSDYVTTQALQTLNATGIVHNWMGFTWIVSNRLLDPGTGEISCLAFTPQALGLAVNQDLMVEIGKDPGKSYMWQAFVQMTAGAVRIEDEQIVHLHLKDALV